MVVVHRARWSGASEVCWAMARRQASCADLELPAIDDRLVEPGTPYEIMDGRLIYVSPADPPHGTRQAQIAALLEAHAAPEFDVACELLTRTSRRDDIAPDVSLFPHAPHPETGGRQLDHIAFEIVSTQSFHRARRKLAKLRRRGVRRVFLTDVKRSRALEWSLTRRALIELPIDGYIEDPALDVALPVEALIRSAKIDDVLALALLLKHNPVLESARAADHAAGVQEGLAEGRQQGLAEGRRTSLAEGVQRGLAQAVLALLAVREIPLRDLERTRILDEPDVARLRRWLTRSASCTSVDEILTEP
jgi:Uma2 family endonuclease